MPNGRRTGSRIRRTIRCFAFVVFLSSFCVIVTNASFSELPRGCRHHYRAAWGFSSARSAAIKSLQSASKCPSFTQISTAGRAAQIGANLFRDPADECTDTSLITAIEVVCGPSWRLQFASFDWHSHADGAQYLPGHHWYIYFAGLFPILLALFFTVFERTFK